MRDVAVFQLKMVVSNLRDWALIPISLGAAAGDLITRGQREGTPFYSVLRWAAKSERVIDVYSSLERREGEAHALSTHVNPSYTIDAVVSRLEGVVVRECEKGGTAASIKAAMDRAIDQLHNETRPTRAKATELVTRAADSLRQSIRKDEAIVG